MPINQESTQFASQTQQTDRIPAPTIPQIIKRNKEERHLSDLLDTHQVGPTEVKTSQPGQDHHHSLDQTVPLSPRKQTDELPSAVARENTRSRRE